MKASLFLWRNELSKISKPLQIDTLSSFVHDNHFINPVLVDCTCDQGIAEMYNTYLQAGFHVVTPNKKANTSSMEYYDALRHSATKTRRQFLYETTVGAGLPVIDTLQSLFRAGDQLIKFEGILSGSLSYIFGKLEEGLSLSEATQQAKNNGYTEPDPREDLSGMDVARKVLIIAREAGLKLSIDDINVETFIPHDLMRSESPDIFMEQLTKFDSSFANRVQSAMNTDKVLRYVGSINQKQCNVKIIECNSNHPLYSVKNGENALAIYTEYYQPLPFVLRGYGAGAAVTAAGIFGDMLRTLG